MALNYPNPGTGSDATPASVKHQTTEARNKSQALAREAGHTGHPARDERTIGVQKLGS
jgi:hypothetical protein